MTLSPGTTLGPYQIVSQLGSGGMGVVYTATDPRLDRRVAIKLLPPDLTRDETAKQRFLQEAKAASALDHPNICTIFEINETPDGQLYLVMAHYEGETLKERIARGPLELSDAIDVATQVGEGLAKAHAAGIVHRDIKPANLMVTTDGTVKILDFGLAKLAGAEGMTQTPRSAPSPTCRPNKPEGKRSITARTSGRSEWCCTRCWRASRRFRGRRSPPSFMRPSNATARPSPGRRRRLRLPWVGH